MSNIVYSQIELNNIGVGFGVWQRVYPNLSEQTFLVNQQHDPGFRATAAMYSISSEIGVYNNFALETRLGYWREVFETHTFLNDNFGISERIDQMIFPGYLGMVYNWRDVIKKYVNAYAGAGVNRYFIRNSFSRLVEDGSGDIIEDVDFGNDYGLGAKLGLEYLFPEFFSLAFEGRYHHGSYRQRVDSPVNNESISRKIDLKGFEIGIFLRYNFSY